MSSTMASMDSVCDDVLLLLFDKYLDLQSLLRCQSVCHRFKQLVNQSFEAKRALILTDKYKNMDYIIDQNFTKYSVLSVQDLCELRDGLWFRSSRGLKLLTSVEISMFALRKYSHLKALCLVVTNRCPLESLFDDIIANCGHDLEKLIVVNINGQKFNINCKQMNSFCLKFSQLRYFEVYTDYLYTSEECFAQLITKCQRLEVFKLNVRQVFAEPVVQSLGQNSHSITYESFRFSGYCFAQSVHQLSTIHVSNAVLSDKTIISLATNGSLKSVKDLGVQRLSQTGMKAICDSIESLESLSFSMDDNLNANETKNLLSFVGQLNCLRKLSICWFGRQYYSPMVPELDEYVVKDLQNCSKLRDITIKEAILRESSLKAIAKHIQSLESIRIIDCTLSDDTFKANNYFKNLKRLVIAKSLSDTSLKFTINRFDDQLVEQIVVKCYEFGFIPRNLSPSVPILVNDEQMNGQEDVVFAAQHHNIIQISSDSEDDDDHHFDHLNGYMMADLDF